MKLTIVETGLVPEPLRADWPSYPAQFEALFSAIDPAITYETISLPLGEALPDPVGLEAVLLTGSPAGVYDPEPWMANLFDFIRWSAEARTPLVGICFGHQAMAQAMGGVAEKVDRGWGVGRHVYSLVERPEWLDTDAGDFACACSHQDQVTVQPPATRVLARSDFTPHAALVYDAAPFLSFQPHPEFTPEYSAALHRLRAEKIGTARTETALRSLAEPLDRMEIGQWILGFLQSARRTEPA